MFAVYHGPKGLEEIARRIHTGTLLLAKGLREEGNDVETKGFFDTIKVNKEYDYNHNYIFLKEIMLTYFLWLK